jgi:quercetin dioxygenase-like cupin family protein
MEEVEPRVWDVTDFGAVGVTATELVRGTTYAVTVLGYAPGAVLGRHPAGWWQLFAVATGAGWVASADGVRRPLATGEAVLWQPGEEHDSGSDQGMTVTVVQAAERPV